MMAAPPIVDVVYVSIRCTKWLRIRGEMVICNELLARVNIDRWEQDTASEAQQKCGKCHAAYTLAEYR